MRHNRNRLFSVIIVTLFAVSCGGGAALGPNNPSKNAANLTLDSSSLSFSNVAVGSSKTNSLTLANSSAAGGLSISVTQITVSGTGYTVTTPALPMTLIAGQSSTVSITFAPKSSGTANGTLTITVAGASQPVSVPLTGNGLASGQLSASPSTMNFGNVTIDGSQNQTGSLTAGSSDVNVSSAAWSGAGYSVSSITFPTIVKAGTSTPFTVTFAPQSTGSSPGQVSFYSDATNSPAVVTFTGTGIPHTVSLSWSMSTSQVVGYNVYRGTTSGGPYTKINSSLISGLSFTDNNVQGGSTYFYAATAVNSSNAESGYSNVATATIP